MKNLYVRNLLVLIFSILVITLEAKEPEATVKGIIVSGDSKSSVAYSTVSVFSYPYHEFIKGTTTDANGQYQITSLPAGKYYVEVSCVGYEKLKFEIEINDSASPSIVKNITLNPSMNKLNEVTVTDYLIREKDEVNKTVFTITEKMSEVSSNGIDVLKHIPGVTVDFQKNVSLEGSSNILFIVDGVERDKDFVNQLLPQDISKVEIMTNPGVAYSTDVDAVISIVLRKRPVGGRGHISGQLPNPQATVAEYSGSLEYGTEKYRLFINDHTHFERFSAIIDNKTEMMTKGDDILLTEKGKGTALWGNNSLNYGMDFFISDRTFLNLYGSAYQHLSNHKDYEQNGNLFLDGNISDSYLLQLNRRSLGKSFFQSAFFKHQFNEKSNLSSQVNYYNYQADKRNNYTYDYDIIDGLTDDFVEFTRKEQISNKRNKIDCKTDFKQTFSKIQFDAGILTYFQEFDNEYETTNAPEEFFQYQEFRQEAYANISGKFNALKYSGGLRGLYSSSSIHNEKVNSYFELLPQLSLQYVFANKSSLKLNGRRQIARPGMEQLNPFVTQTDSLSIAKGNPDLEPQFINKVELQYAAKYKSFYIAPKLFLNYSDNSIQQVSYLNQEGISVRQPLNVGNVLDYGIRLSASYSLKKWFKINGSGSIYRASVSSSDNYSESKNGWSVNGSAIVSPWEKVPVNFTLSAQYHSPRLGYKSVTRRDLLIFAGIDAKITKNFSASAYVIPFDFNFTYNATETTDTNYYHSNIGQINARYLFAVELAYKFKWGNDIKKIDRSTDYEKDGGGGSL